MKKNSLGRETWKYFLIFSVIILGFLWFFQVFFLDNYYSYEKTKDAKELAQLITENNYYDKDFRNKLNNLALEKETCIEIIDKNFYSLYATSYFGKGCSQNKEVTSNYKFDFINSNSIEKSYNLMDEEDNSILVYALKIDTDAYAFITTSLSPISSTATIITKQLIIVTIVVLLLSFVIAYFISSYISKPIVQMGRAATKLAGGDFSVNFSSDSKILEIKELSETLNLTKNELEKTEELRRDLMANVSHDLKTPLTLIKAYAEMSRDLHSKDKKKQKENMDTIISEADRLTLLVNDILELSKVQSNLDKLEVEEFNLVEVVEEIIKRYQILEELENYHFNFACKRKKIIVKADKKKIEQVIYNLINNAINYTGEDKTVTVSINDERDKITVDIIDTGKGISKEELPYIWDKYYKDKKKHKRNVVGTGLGLSIVKNILKLHNYEYGVKSEINNGSDFYFIISKDKS